MKNQLPLSVRLDVQVEKDLGELASRAGLKKATLAQILLEAAVRCLRGTHKLSLPVEFALKK